MGIRTDRHGRLLVLRRVGRVPIGRRGATPTSWHNVGQCGVHVRDQHACGGLLPPIKAEGRSGGEQASTPIDAPMAGSARRRRARDCHTGRRRRSNCAPAQDGFSRPVVKSPVYDQRLSDAIAAVAEGEVARDVRWCRSAR